MRLNADKRVLGVFSVSAMASKLKLKPKGISSVMGLKIKALAAADLWKGFWQRFNDSEPIDIPQLITLDETGLQEQVYSDLASTKLLIENLHSTTLLMESKAPYAERRWVNVIN